MPVCSNCSQLSQLELLAKGLIDGLKAELYLTPKPGLVDLNNCGSHQDLDLVRMNCSIALMRDYLSELCSALEQGRGWQDLVYLGQKAELRMLTETGTNCHKGGIFLCGLVLIAASRIDSPDDPHALKQSIREAAGEFFRVKKVTASHGNKVRAEFPQAGIVGEAVQGLPALFDTFLPAMTDPSVAFHLRPMLAMAALMQTVEDSTSLHRCGYDGLLLLKQAGRKLENTLRRKEDPYPLLYRQDLEFQMLNLTMGGVATFSVLVLGTSTIWKSILISPVISIRWAHPIKSERK